MRLYRRMPCISIHPPRVGRDVRRPGVPFVTIISIHPPRVGRDWATDAENGAILDFNPPAPGGAGP